jgi:hypothetical protein
MLDAGELFIHESSAGGRRRGSFFAAAIRMTASLMKMPPRCFAHLLTSVHELVGVAQRF